MVDTEDIVVSDDPVNRYVSLALLQCLDFAVRCQPRLTVLRRSDDRLLNVAVRENNPSSDDTAFIGVSGELLPQNRFTGNRAAQVNWLSLSERIRWQ